MRVKGSVLIAGIYLSIFDCTAGAQVSAEAVEAYQRQQWLVAISHLEKQKTEPGAMRMLALSYFQEMDFERALPALRSCLLVLEDDIELNTAMLEVLLDARMSAAAAKIASHLEDLGETDRALFGQARTQLQLPDGDRELAKQQLQDLVERADPELATRAADVLIEELYQDGQFDTAYGVAQTAVRRDPGSPYADRFSLIRPEVTASSGFGIDLAYRVEYDDNVAYPDEDFTSGEEDYRHVLIADVLYDRPFGAGWSFYAQGHFLQSLYHQLDQFNQTHVSASVAIGKSAEKIGWRLPVEINHDWLDGHSYRTSMITRPGLYVQFGGNFFSHFYARIQSDDYETVPDRDEDRSGDVYGAGVLVAGQVTSRFQLHGYLEYNRYDTDGAFWQRDEMVAFVYAELKFSPKWLAGLAFRYQKENFDNARPVFALRQKDESEEVYLNLTHQFAAKWRWRGQLSLVNHESNIPIFDYTRNVYSFSIIREF